MTFRAISISSRVRFLIDCVIVPALSILMVLSFLSRLRVSALARTAAVSLSLFFILALLISNVEAWKPATFFGRYQDDAVYFFVRAGIGPASGLHSSKFSGPPASAKVSNPVPRAAVRRLEVVAGVLRITHVGDSIEISRKTEAAACRSVQRKND